MRLTKEQKQAVKEFENKLLEEQRQKDILINHKTDWGYLEQLIQKVNENPDLVVEISTADGAKIKLKTFNEKSRNRDRINGIYNVE